jgi:hypothetical protein
MLMDIMQHLTSKETTAGSVGYHQDVAVRALACAGDLIADDDEGLREFADV